MASMINIVGGGISGLAAAIVLAKAGKQVVVHEKTDQIGKRFRGDLQGIENWSTKQDVLEILQSFGIDTNFPKSPFKKVDFTDGRISFSGKASEPLFYLVKRGTETDSLDTALSQQALACGVEIKYHSTYPLEQADIIATGPIRDSTVAMDRGIVFATDHPDIAVGIFGDDLAYLGYSYFLVTKGYGCLCSVAFNDFKTLNPCFEKTVDFVTKKYGVKIENAKPVGGFGSFILNHPAQLGSAYLVGEAAGLQDMLWGFGIRTAMTSGYLAAKSILEGTDYNSALKSHLSVTQEASLVNRYLWEKLKLGQYPILPYFIGLPISVRKLFRWLYGNSKLHRLLSQRAMKYVSEKYPECVYKNS